MALPVVTVQGLVEYTRLSKANTFSEYLQNLNEQTELLKQSGVVSYHAGIDLFVSFVAKLPGQVDHFKSEIIMGAEAMIAHCDEFRDLCAFHGINFIKENSTILVHSHSRLVILLLKKAALSRRNFKVLVTAAMPKNSG